MNDLIIDCFAGGGGASTGIELALNRPIDIAINHDPDAILMHKTNHPHTLHLTEDIFEVDLQKHVRGRRVSLMWASPDCTSHSKAKGGQPRKRGLRILPWAVYKHAREIRPEVIIMENVEEIQQWGPLDDAGHPIASRKGEDYKKFIFSMEALGYEFDSRELVAADYGAPTTRKRWYAVFRRDRRGIVWPEPTHGAIYDADKRAVKVHDCKIDAFLELVEQLNGQHALVFYNFQHDRDRLVEALAKYNLNVRVYSRAKDEIDWNNGEIDILLAHPASCGYGLNLQQGGHHAIWFGLTWSLEQYEQANKRLHRQGQEHPVVIHHLIVQGGMDEVVLDALQNKSDMQNALMDALRVRINKLHS